jgi:hypothetical protein
MSKLNNLLRLAKRIQHYSEIVTLLESQGIEIDRIKDLSNMQGPFAKEVHALLSTSAEAMAADGSLNHDDQFMHDMSELLNKHRISKTAFEPSVKRLAKRKSPRTAQSPNK